MRHLSRVFGMLRGRVSDDLNNRADTRFASRSPSSVHYAADTPTTATSDFVFHDARAALSFAVARAATISDAKFFMLIGTPCVV